MQIECSANPPAPGCHDGKRPLGLYFGCESGEVFASIDAGATWFTAAEHLAPVTSVRCSS